MKRDQEEYKRLRELSKEQLWLAEVPSFNAASPRARIERVALIRAVGMIFSRFGNTAEKAEVRAWLTEMLRDPQEKIRRYAMTALPKIGATEAAEEQMISLLQEGSGEREKRHLGRVLEKVGGTATLSQAAKVLDGTAEQKVKAALLRQEQPGAIRLQERVSLDAGARLFLRCRRGLEGIVRDEAREKLDEAMFKTGEVRPGCVTLSPRAPFSLAMLYELRCFATVGFSLDLIENGEGEEWIEGLASAIASPTARKVMIPLTEGTPRYRLDFPARGHQRGAIRAVTERAYALAPEILNDARQALWSIDVLPVGVLGRQVSVELRPRLYPDPRLAYRQDDIAAASHPPLAAAMARLAAKAAFGRTRQTIWDPFCGSGLELIERSLLGGVSKVIGTDLEERALEVARANFSAASLGATQADFIQSDFRDVFRDRVIEPASVSVVISNPPLGRRVRVKDLRGLFGDFFSAASRALKPDGLLIVTNPLQLGPNDPSLRLESSQTVDLGGFNCQLEMYRKVR